MKNAMKGNLSIGRMQSVRAEQNNKIIIEVKDDFYNTIVEIEVSAEKFMLAITGLAFQECEVKINEC